MATFSGEPRCSLFLNPLLVKQLLPVQWSWHKRQNPFIMANLNITRGMQAQNSTKLGNLNYTMWHAVWDSETQRILA